MCSTLEYASSRLRSRWENRDRAASSSESIPNTSRTSRGKAAPTLILAIWKYRSTA
jgi:hypothetical protein